MDHDPISQLASSAMLRAWQRVAEALAQLAAAADLGMLAFLEAAFSQDQASGAFEHSATLALGLLPLHFLAVRDLSDEV